MNQKFTLFVSEGRTAIAGFSVRGIYAAELLAERSGAADVSAGDLCAGRWLDFADTVAAVDDGGLEFYQVLATEWAESPPFSKLRLGYLAVGRGETKAEAEAALGRNVAQVAGSLDQRGGRNRVTSQMT